MPSLTEEDGRTTPSLPAPQVAGGQPTHVPTEASKSSKATDGTTDGTPAGPSGGSDDGGAAELRAKLVVLIAERDELRTLAAASEVAAKEASADRVGRAGRAPQTIGTVQFHGLAERIASIEARAAAR